LKRQDEKLGQLIGVEKRHHRAGRGKITEKRIDDKHEGKEILHWVTRQTLREGKTTDNGGIDTVVTPGMGDLQQKSTEGMHKCSLRANVLGRDRLVSQRRGNGCR